MGARLAFVVLVVLTASDTAQSVRKISDSRGLPGRDRTNKNDLEQRQREARRVIKKIRKKPKRGEDDPSYFARFREKMITLFDQDCDEDPGADFSVLTWNLWGFPQPVDEELVFNETRLQSAMQEVVRVVRDKNPVVLAFQEYNHALFKDGLAELWAAYTGCKTVTSGVVIAVRNGVDCKIGHTEPFEDLDGCNPHSRSYQSVEIKPHRRWITVAGLHLHSGGAGRSSPGCECRKASLGRAFQIVKQSQSPGVVMGDMNWFAQNQEDLIDWTTVRSAHHFVDSAMTTNRKCREPASTFPTWISDDRPSHCGARLDRVFYTQDGLMAVEHELVGDQNLPHTKKLPLEFRTVSDHMGTFVTFKMTHCHQVKAERRRDRHTDKDRVKKSDDDKHGGKHQHTHRQPHDQRVSGMIQGRPS